MDGIVHFITDVGYSLSVTHPLAVDSIWGLGANRHRCWVAERWNPRHRCLPCRCCPRPWATPHHPRPFLLWSSAPSSFPAIDRSHPPSLPPRLILVGSLHHVIQLCVPSQPHRRTSDFLPSTATSTPWISVTGDCHNGGGGALREVVATTCDGRSPPHHCLRAPHTPRGERERDRDEG
jgi:hypothetical protein